MHADLFRGMYTSQGSGDILVRMCGSWENFVVHQRTFDAFSNQVKQCFMPFYAFLRLSHDLQTFLNVLMHAELFSGMYTSQRSDDILVRMCGSWENFVVHQRTFDAFSNKWNSSLCLFMHSPPLTWPSGLFKCSNACRSCSVRCTLAKHQVIILVRMCGSWEKNIVYQRTCRRILKQVKQCIMPFYAFGASHTTCRLV